MFKKDLAKLCHETNRLICESIGDGSQPHWEDSEDWMREATMHLIKVHSDNPNLSSSATHVEWMQEKINNGWRYGEIKDGVAKTHPLMIPYEDLPAEQKAKDTILKAIINSLSPVLED